MNMVLVVLSALAVGVGWYIFRSRQIRQLSLPKNLTTSTRDHLIEISTKLGSGEIDQQEYDKRRAAVLGVEKRDQEE